MCTTTSGQSPPPTLIDAVQKAANATNVKKLGPEIEVDTINDQHKTMQQQTQVLQPAQHDPLHCFATSD